MANIKLKPINELELWNTKELRKLQITLKNRIESLNLKYKELPQSHPLHGMKIENCKDLLEEVKRAEKELTK